MKRKMIQMVAVVLMAAMVLSGCQMIGDALDRYYSMMQWGMATAFEDMEYVRPDMTAYRQSLEKTMGMVDTEKDVDTLMESVLKVYELYYDFSTNYNLAQICYFKDMTDTYWEKEYNWCMEQTSEVSGSMDQLLYALADCSLREELEQDQYFGPGFFEMYEGDSLWDETFTELMNRETALLDRYYDLSAQAIGVEYYSEEYFSGVGLQIEELFLELIRARQEIAEYAGYESYPEFAYEFYFYRDYTPAQAQGYMNQISKELAPLYPKLDPDTWAPAQRECSEGDTFAYVKELARAMGGVPSSAFELMESLNLYDLSRGENKYDASFEVFLISYYSPYIFVNPIGTEQDKLSFTHEFGHFCNDYGAGGSVVGIDVAEVFSQGLEYLSLQYCENTEELARMKLADSLCVFVEQSVYASFENQVYLLENPTVEDVRGVYEQVNRDFGLESFGRDTRDYTLVPHLFISPMYVISYVVSNDGAMQIYQKELESQGTGLALWENGLQSMEMGYLAFVKEQGLESPFAEGRVAKLREVFEEKLMK